MKPSPPGGRGVSPMTDAEQIRHLSEYVERLKREVMEYVRAEKVLIAAGYITEEKVREAHELVRDLP